MLSLIARYMKAPLRCADLRSKASSGYCQSNCTSFVEGKFLLHGPAHQQAHHHRYGDWPSKSAALTAARPYVGAAEIPLVTVRSAQVRYV